MLHPKNFDAFTATLNQKGPAQEWPQPLQALWWDAKGNWEAAHNFVDGSTAPMADAVHAYLHRKEGDEWNANYWYESARRPFFDGPLEAEWEALVKELLG